MIKFQFKRMTSNEECESFQRKRLKTEVELSFDLDFFVQIFGLIFRRTRQTLWRAVQMLTQKLCFQTIHDCPKVVPLHYESE